MKKVISLIKRCAKAYFRQAAKAYAWTPTGTSSFDVGVNNKYYMG